LGRHVLSLERNADPAAPAHPRAGGLMQTQGKSGGLSDQFADVLAAAGLRAHQPHRAKGESRARRARNALSFHSLRHTA
jgi:hypothetical protein